MSPTAGLEWKARVRHSGSTPARTHRTAPDGSIVNTPPPPHLPLSAQPLATTTSSAPVPYRSAAEGEELMGWPVATGHPGTSAPESASSPYTPPFRAPTTTAGRPRLACTGDDSRNVIPGHVRSQANSGRMARPVTGPGPPPVGDDQGDGDGGSVTMPSWETLVANPPTVPAVTRRKSATRR